jgi:hypothetical protein
LLVLITWLFSPPFSDPEMISPQVRFGMSKKDDIPRGLAFLDTINDRLYPLFIIV